MNRILWQTASTGKSDFQHCHVNFFKECSSSMVDNSEPRVHITTQLDSKGVRNSNILTHRWLCLRVCYIERGESGKMEDLKVDT